MSALFLCFYDTPFPTPGYTFHACRVIPFPCGPFRLEHEQPALLSAEEADAYKDLKPLHRRNIVFSLREASA